MQINRSSGQELIHYYISYVLHCSLLKIYILKVQRLSQAGDRDKEFKFKGYLIYIMVNLYFTVKKQR